MKTVDASDLQARCPALLDHVSRTGERVVILKRGRPVAELGPPRCAVADYPQMELKGTVTVIGDIVGPAISEEQRQVARKEPAVLEVMGVPSRTPVPPTQPLSSNRSRKARTDKWP